MTPTNYIRVRSAAGITRAILTGTGNDGGDNGFLYVAWKKRVNDVDYAELEVTARNPDLQYLVDKAILEIWRSDPDIGLAEYRTFQGIIRDDIPYTTKDNQERIKVRAFGYNSLLARRRVAYPANKNMYTVFTSQRGETVLKRLVRDNCDPTFATTGNDRDRTPSTLALTIQTDAAAGPLISWAAGNRPNLLAELQKVVRIAGGDFAVVNTAAAEAAPAFEFRFYVGQLGADRTSGANAIVFSTDRGNMSNPKLERIRSAEKTVMLVAGRGEDSARVVRVRTGPNFAAANDIEDLIDGKNAVDNATLDALGDSALQAAKFRNKIDYDVIQTRLYGVEKDYFLGDLVLAKYGGIDTTQQVYETAFEYKTAREAISITMLDR